MTDAERARLLLSPLGLCGELVNNTHACIKPIGHTGAHGESSGTGSADEVIVAATDVDESATPGPWLLWTSNSFRRITGPDGRDGGVLSGTVAHDGVPDLTGYNLANDLRFIVASRTLVPQLRDLYLDMRRDRDACANERDRLERQAREADVVRANLQDDLAKAESERDQHAKLRDQGERVDSMRAWARSRIAWCDDQLAKLPDFYPGETPPHTEQRTRSRAERTALVAVLEQLDPNHPKD